MKRFLTFLILGIGLSTLCHAREGVLPIDQAYKLSVDASAPGVLRLHWSIAPDYYLYRGQMKFAGGKGTTLAGAQLPPGEKLHDEYLGDVEIYHNSVEATLRYTLASGANHIRFSVRYQGCHEVEPKICYPPHTVAFDLPARASTGSSTSASSTAGSVASAHVPGSLHETSSGSTDAAAYNGTPAARVALAAGDAAGQKGDFAGAIANYKKAIALDPNFVKAQEQYLFSRTMRFEQQALMTGGLKSVEANSKKIAAETDRASKAVMRENEALAAQHPDKAVYPFILAQLYIETDISRTEHYCHQAVQIDPRFAQGYECLAQMAFVRSDNAKAVAWQRKAMQLDPTNAEMAAGYLSMIEDEPALFKAESARLLQRFPHSDAILYPLYRQAASLEPDSARIAALEQLRRDLPSKGSDTSEQVDRELFGYYLGTDLSKALAVAQEATKAGAGDEGKSWKTRVAYVDALLQAQNEIRMGHAEAALKALDGVQKQKDEQFAFAKTWYLLRARALVAAGRTADAVTLLRDDYVLQPTDGVLNALLEDGEKLGKTKGEIYADIWAALKAKTKPAPNFTLRRFDSGKPVSLSDYKGKVVIVDFWYPECEPCRESFPYLQRVAAKFKDEGVTVLAINGMQKQEKLVLPFLRSRGYDFLALKGNEKFAKNVYGVNSYPNTFIVGADGNIYFRPFIYDDARARSAEEAIKLLLTRVKS